MAGENLKQRSLGDALLIDHDALQELDGVHGLIDCSRLASKRPSCWLPAFTKR